MNVWDKSELSRRKYDFMAEPEKKEFEDETNPKSSRIESTH